MEPTDIQKRIIENIGNTVVLASPGSGKTFVLSRMIENALSSDDILSYQGIVAISYTKKASANLKIRTLKYGIKEKNSFFGTIDSFCLSQIIQPFGSYVFGHPKKELEVITLNDIPETETHIYSWIKDIHPDYGNIQDDQLKHLSALYTNGYVLIESLSLLGLHLIKQCAACSKYLKARFKKVFIDEYQDADTYVHDIFLSLVELGLTGVAVGDVNQSIFGYAHKESKFLKVLESNGLFTAYKLDKNFRCSIPIINYANRILDKDSEIIPTQNVGVVLVRTEGDESNIANFIDEKIERYHEKYKNAKLSGIAVLVRFIHTQNIMDQYLKSKHRVIESTPLDDDLNPRSQLYGQLLGYYFDKRVSFLSISDEYVEYDMLSEHERKKLNEAKKEIRSVEVNQIHKLPHIFQAVADVLLPKVPERNSLKILRDIIDNGRLLKSYHPAQDDEIQIMTLHKSKGLEFDIVFHLNLNEWEFPSREYIQGDYSTKKYQSWNQDLNLHYVGVTRARKGCFLMKGTLRTKKNGEIKKAEDSPFLSMNNLSDLRKEI